MLDDQDKAIFRIIADNLLATIPGHVYWKTKEGIFLGCSEEHAKYLGFSSAEEIIGKTNFDLIDNKGEAEEVTKVDNYVIQTGKMQVIEEKHGSRWFLSKKIPLRNSQKEIIGLFGLSMDITDQKEYELNKNIAADNLLTHIPGHFYWKNKEGKVLGCNEEHARYFGRKEPRDIIGKTIFDLVNKEDAIKTAELDNFVMKTGKTQIAEEKHCSRWFLSKKAPLKDFKGEIVGLLGLSLEITEQKKLEERLKHQTQELAAALEAKERFLRNMSHEIRIPLQAMLYVPKELKHQCHNLTHKEIEKYLDLIITANERFESLLSNLLDLSKFRHGKFIMDFKKENIIDIVKGVIGEFKYMHGNITLDVASDVPQDLVCDAFRVSQIVRNLIGNSIKHGGKDLPIFISLSSHYERRKPFIKCTVKDNGAGIPDQEKEIIFEPFAESTRTRTNAGGTGLGLAIAKEIVEAHKGEIWVGNLEEGETGARFHFTLSALIEESEQHS